MNSNLLKLLLCVIILNGFNGLSAETARILAIGDSLTEGFWNKGESFHPYTNKLQELLNASENVDWQIENEGRSGEPTGAIKERLFQKLQQSEKAESRYDYIIILAGTNDVGLIGVIKLEDAKQNLIDMFQMSWKHGAKVIVLNLPDANIAQPRHNLTTVTRYHQRRDELRKFISAQTRKLPQSDRELIDLDTLIPYRCADTTDIERYWDDELHMKPAGYDKIAKEIFEVINANPGFKNEGPRCEAAYCNIL